MATESRSKPTATQVGLDRLYWLVVISLVVGGIFGNWYFQNESLLVRVIALLVVAAAAGFTLLQTERGKALWALGKDARAEVRRVVWPTRQVTIQTTMIVILMVMVVALILWGLDSLLSWGIKSALG
ncbi:MAG: preprotein translocase subunit SecE [Gammaproteobacteria bacterium]|nr:preprotein translocase subunit SecE [Gammaproteobacteria bacterium]